MYFDTICMTSCDTTNVVGGSNDMNLNLFLGDIGFQRPHRHYIDNSTNSQELHIQTQLLQTKTIKKSITFHCSTEHCTEYINCNNDLGYFGSRRHRKVTVIK